MYIMSLTTMIAIGIVTEAFSAPCQTSIIEWKSYVIYIWHGQNTPPGYEAIPQSVWPYWK